MIKSKIGLLLLGVLFSLSACQDSVIPDPDPGKDTDKLVPVTLNLNDLDGNNIKTYGLVDGGYVPGTVAENAVTNVLVYIFKTDGTCEKILQGTGASLPIGPELITTGVKDFVAVVNTSGNITGLPIPGQESSITYATLMQKVSDIKASTPLAPFLMTGKKTVTVPQVTAANAYAVEVEVARTVSKVTLNFTKSALAALSNIVITKLTMFNGADRVGLFQTPNPNPTIYNLQKSTTSFGSYNGVAPTGTLPLKNGTDYCISLDTFYTYENLAAKNKAQATYFEMEALVNGGSTKKCRFYLAEDPKSPTDTVWDVKRNYWYNVNVDVTDPGCDSIYVQVISSPWNLEPPQNVTPGGGYEANTALPFKLVKTYTDDELSSGTNGTFAAIDKHSKGESYIDLKVTAGTSWSLAFKSGNAANADAKMALDATTSSWTSDWKTSLTGTGDGTVHRIYIYRPYVENAEPDSGPTMTLTVGGKEVRDFVVQPRDTVIVPTNCYIMRPELSGYPTNETRAYIPLKAVYQHWEDELLANGDSIPVGDITAEISWQDHSGTIVKNVSVLNPSKRDSAYIYVEAGAAKGNAIVLMKVGSVIYWSFHLWVTEYNPYEAAGENVYETNYSIRNVFMDRNIGALTNVYDADGEARGLFYQHGRKDPFPRGSKWTNTFIWYKSGTQYSNLTTSPFSVAASPASATALRPKSAIIASLHNPTTYYNSVPWTIYQDNNYLWMSKGKKKTAYDPCPEGWRVPYQEVGASDSPWSGLVEGTFNYGTPYLNGRYYSEIGYYPLSGGVTINGQLSGVRDYGYWWTTFRGTSSESMGLRLTSLTGGISFVQDMDKTDARSARCIADYYYIKNGGTLFGDGWQWNNITPP